jgi:hypothetical protein
MNFSGCGAQVKPSGAGMAEEITFVVLAAPGHRRRPPRPGERGQKAPANAREAATLGQALVSREAGCRHHERFTLIAMIC